MFRGVLGVAAGVVVWMLVFFVLALVLAQVWPDYATHGREWMSRDAFTFTPPMACCNLAFWILAEIGAGWITGKIATRLEAVWVLAALIGVYLATLHFLLYWSRFPWWYNLGVVIPAIPAVFLGGKSSISLRLRKTVISNAT